MFVDFNKVFKNKPQTELPVPSAMIEYMNRSLPEGVKYTEGKDGTCIITSTKESLTIGGFTFNPTEDQKKILGKNYTQQDVLDYFYNIQQPMPMTLAKDGYILLNGEEFPVDKIVCNPLVKIEYISGSFFISPSNFPEPFSVNIGCSKYERTMTVSRVPHNSVSTYAFESSKEEALYIHYLLDNKKKSMTMNISFDLTKARYIRDIAESTTIYNAFLDGKGTIFGHPLNVGADKNTKGFDRNSIVFWEKVLKIEEYLGVTFIPPKENVDIETRCLVEQLYQNLINKVPTRYNQIINSVEGKCNFKNDGKDINESLSNAAFFEFESRMQVELFGVRIEVFALNGVFNAALRIQNINDEKQKLIFMDESEKKKRYTSIMCFKSEAELEEYKTKDHSEMITLFREAKRPQEYL